jgi:uncharacterized membrane protein YqaE (UPF0057 family)
MKKILLGTAVLFALVLTSCSTFKNVDIVKRHYNNGYHIAIRDQKTKTEPVAVVKDKQATATTVAATDKIPATPEQPIVLPSVTNESTPAATQTATTKTGTTSKQRNADAPVIASVKKERTKSNHSLRTPVLKPKTWSASRSNSGGGDVDLIILVILAILLPPLAVYLDEGITGKFWLTLILCLLSGGIGPFLVFGWGLWFIAMIIALITVLR